MSVSDCGIRRASGEAGIGGALVDPTRAFGWVDDIVLVFDESGTLVERLLHGPQVDQVLASEDASGDVQWLLGDHLGTIRDVVEHDSGMHTTTVVNHLQYSSFGQITSQTSSTDETRPVEKGDRHAECCLRLIMATAEAASQSPFSTTRYAFTGREGWSNRIVGKGSSPGRRHRGCSTCHEHDLQWSLNGPGKESRPDDVSWRRSFAALWMTVRERWLGEATEVSVAWWSHRLTPCCAFNLKPT